MMPWMDTGSTDGTVIDSGRPEKLEKEGTRGPVGSRELGKVVCSTGNLSQQQKLTKVNKRQALFQFWPAPFLGCVLRH